MLSLKSVYKMSRYFILNVNQSINLPTQRLIDQGHLIFSAKKENGMMYIFNCNDEIIPYDFIKQDKSIKEFEIQEIELHSKGQSKQLAQLFKYR